MNAFVAGQAVRVAAFYDRPVRRQVAAFVGVVWSRGPQRGSWWVTPEDGGPAVVVPSAKMTPRTSAMVGVPR